MNRGAVVGLLALAVVAAVGASLQSGSLAAMSGRFAEISASISRESRYRHMPRLQPAAVGGLIAQSAYDGGYGSPADFQPLTDFPQQQVTVQPAYFDGGYGSPADFQSSQGSEIPYSTDTPPPAVMSKYEKDYQGIPDTQPDLTGNGVQPVSGVPAYDTSSANRGLSETQMYTNRDAYTAYRTDPPVTDAGSWGGRYGGNAPVYNSYNYTHYNTITYTQPQTWYTEAFPGIGQSIVPLLPPIYRPGYNANPYGSGGYYDASLYGNYGGYGGGYGSGTAASLSLFGSGLGLSLGFASHSAPSYVNPYATQPLYQSPTPAAEPTCAINASPSSLAYGGSTALSWVSYNASSAALTGVGAVALTGTYPLAGQTSSRTIGLTVAGAGGTGACYTTILVQPQPTAVPSCVISVSPDHLRLGENANLTWTTQDATSVALSGLGTVAEQGGRSVSPPQTATYVLSVANGSKTASCSTTLVVN